MRSLSHTITAAALWRTLYGMSLARQRTDSHPARHLLLAAADARQEL
jgi:hypothetical protein